MNRITLLSILVAAGMSMFSCTRLESDTYERFYLQTDGADLAVEVNGNIASGTFIILLHGGPGGGSYGYNSGLYSETLEESLAMVYLDQRGQGASQGVYAADDVTLQQFADDIYALVLLMKQKYGESSKIFLMGHSWGGTTGTYALLNTDVQDEITGWIEADGAHDIPLINKTAIPMFLEIGNEEVSAGRNTEQWQEILDFANSVDTSNISVDEGGQINNFGYTAEGLLEQITTGESGEGGFSHGLIGMPIFSLSTVLSNLFTSNTIFDETETTALTNRLREITVPVLLLWGKYDFVVPPALGESALERVSSQDKRLVIFETSGHSPMDSEPEAFSAAIISFVDQYR